MSTSSREKLLWLVREAVVKNTCRPLPIEREAYDPRSIRVSTLREGDSQIGIMLFVGVANELGFTAEEIMMSEGIEKLEVDYKIEKYNEKIKYDKRFGNKRKLVRNFLKLHEKWG